MNVEAYISSGILESYVMDQLSSAERMEVEQAAAQYPEIREELEQIEQTMEALAFATAVSPKAHLKNQLMQQLDLEEKPQTNEGMRVFYPEEEADTKVRSLNTFKYAAAASLVIALGAMLMAFNYWSKWQNAEGQLSELIAQNQQFAENYNTVNQQLDDLQGAVRIMNSSAYKRVMMNGTDNAPQSMATVYWNEATEDVYLSIENLKELSKDQQYQLWAIIDGKPVDAGVFDVNSGRLLLAMKNIGSGAAAFAVTIEPRGGSENPSLETMQVVGEV